jgi:hypothetical protein
MACRAAGTAFGPQASGSFSHRPGGNGRPILRLTVLVAIRWPQTPTASPLSLAASGRRESMKILAADALKMFENSGLAGAGRGQSRPSDKACSACESAGGTTRATVETVGNPGLCRQSGPSWARLKDSLAFFPRPSWRQLKINPFGSLASSKSSNSRSGRGCGMGGPDNASR